MASSFLGSGDECVYSRDVPSKLKNKLQTVCEMLGPLCGILEAKIKTEVDKLQTGVEISVMGVFAEIHRRGADIIKKLTQEIVKIVNAEEERLKNDLENALLTTKNDIDTLLTKNKQLLHKGKENLKLGENLIKSGSDSDIKTNIAKLTKIASEISETNPKIEIPEIKITLTDSKKKHTDTFSADIGEILKPDIKSLTDRQTLTDTQRDILQLTYTWPEMQTHTRTDSRTDRLKLTQTFHTKISPDKLNPWLDSIAVLEGERSKKIVVSDYNNNCVKCFSAENYKLLFSFKLPGTPYGLARSRDQQVVVALPLVHQILYLDIQDDIRLTNTLDTGKPYSYISVLPSNRLAASEWWMYEVFGSGGCVDILDEWGRVIHSVCHHLIHSPWCLTVKGDSLVVVSDTDTLKCVTPSGHVTWESRDSTRLRNLRGVACDMEEFVYVCADERNCIVQLSREGEVIRDVITYKDGLSKPLFVCCDQNKLYVAQRDGHVKIFTWSKANP